MTLAACTWSIWLSAFNKGVAHSSGNPGARATVIGLSATTGSGISVDSGVEDWVAGRIRPDVEAAGVTGVMGIGGNSVAGAAHPATISPSQSQRLRRVRMTDISMDIEISLQLLLESWTRMDFDPLTHKRLVRKCETDKLINKE